MASHIAVCPRMSPKREIKLTLKSFCNEKSSAEGLQRDDAGIKDIPSNTSKYYDQLPDPTPMLGAVPARGTASVPAIEIIKWSDTSNCSIVLELVRDVKFSCASSHKAIYEYKEAKALGVNTVPVLVVPVSYLLLSKPAKGVDKTFSSLLGKIIPIYKEVVSELRISGASWTQFDELTLVMDLDSHKLQAFTEAYAQLESSISGLNVLVENSFADIPAEAYKVLTSLKGVPGFGFDLDLIKGAFPKGKFPFAGVINGRNIWANDLAASLSTLNALEGIVGKDKLVVSISCFLLHAAVDLVHETKLDEEIKSSWLAFSAQKVVDVNMLAKALAGQKDEIHTRICYSHFNDIIPSIIDMDVDVITTENSRSDEKLLLVFHEGVKYGARIGPVVNVILSLRIPPTKEIADQINKVRAKLEKNILWVDPDCGLKTGKHTEVKPALKNMVSAAKVLRTQLTCAH